MASLPKKLLIRCFGAIPPRWVRSLSQHRSHHPFIDRVMNFAAMGMSNADLPIQHGVGRGLLFNSGTSHPSFLMGTCDPSTQVALQTLLVQGMTFFDIGANVGYFTVIAARLVGPYGRVVSFEPLPANSRLISHNAGINGFRNVRLVEVAIGGSDGRVDLGTWAENSRSKVADSGKPPNRMTSRITVKLQKLDSWMADTVCPKPDVIRIDVGGSEVDVLEGAVNILREYRPRLLIELHGTNAAVDEALDKLGYKSIVLDDTAGIMETRSDAHVVAIPTQQYWPEGLPALGSTKK